MTQELIAQEPKTLTEYKLVTNAIRKQATDIANDPIVQAGYQTSGRSGSTAFLNITSMALKRVRKYYPLSRDLKDPLYARLAAVFSKFAAECIKLKYETRAERTEFNHLKELDRRCAEFMNNEYHKTSEEVRYLTAFGGDNG